MNKKTIITILLALVAVAGQAQVKCHVEGTLETDAWGDEVIICEAGTDLRVVDEPRFHVKAKDGHFTYDIETDFPRLYDVFFLKQYETGRWFAGKFIAENCTVNVTMYENKRVRIVSNGEEGRKHAVKDSIEDVRFWNPVEEIDNKLEDPDRRAEFFKADFISAINEAKTWNVDSLPQAYVDSIRQIINHYMQNRDEMYTTKGWQLKQRRDSITNGLRPFRIAYAEEHPMLWTLYDVLDAIDDLKHADNYVNFDKSQFEPYLTLYHDKLINYSPGHPIHEQIATAETAYRLQPGKPYIDYMVRNTDGKLVPISTLIQGKVALIDRDGTILSTSTDAEELESIIKKALNID